jgi:hypothetical protein
MRREIQVGLGLPPRRAFGLQKNHQHHVDADGSNVPVTLKFNR